ncbi:MAG: glycosyltransferase [Candidatus Dormibacteraeota bacterium]|nr:glycosyltransferase [Candidatus Dormibacteraeota bacterium]
MSEFSLPQPRTIAVIAAHSCPYSEVGGAENGGMSVYIRSVTEALARRGLRSVIFTRKEFAAAPSELDVPEGCHLVHVSAGPEKPLDKAGLFYHLPEFSAGVHRWTRDNNVTFDLVHSHYWLGGWVGRRLSQGWGVPWLHMAHTLGRIKDRDRPEGANRESDQRIAVELEIARSCNRLVAPTSREVDDLAYLYGADRSCIDVVPLGVDLERFHPIDSDPLRARLGLRGDEQVVLFTGRLERLKGVETLIRALPLLPVGRSPRRLLVAGADSGNGVSEAGAFAGERARLAALAEELGVGHQVTFLGAVDHQELPLYYSLADVCAVPSYSESFGLVALEAQACGTPVVASRVGGLAQVVSDGITGFTVLEHDPASYARRLGLVLDDGELRARMGAAGVELAAGYTWDATATRLELAYRSTVQSYGQAVESLLG